MTAGAIEAAVIGQLQAVVRQPEIVAGAWTAARVEEETGPPSNILWVP